MDMSALQGMTSSGMILPTPQPMPQQSLMSGMGPWSQLAYQMAGSPKQGGLYAPVAPPTALPGSYSTPSRGGSGLGGLLTGLLGAAARNPNAISQIGGLLGGGLPATAASEAASGVAGVSAANTVAPLTTAQLGLAPSGALTDSSLTSLYGGAGLGGGGSGGLLGGATAYGTDAGIAPASGLLGTTGATGSSAAATTGGLTAGSAATAAGVLGVPIAAYALLDHFIGGPNDQGNAALKAWMANSGATYKASPGQSNVGGNTFQTQQFASATNPGQFLGANGQPMSQQDVLSALRAYAKANGLPLGNLG